VRVLIVGAGAVGSLLAWGLATAGESVTIVRRGSGATSDAALHVTRPDGPAADAAVRVAASVHDAVADAPELVLVAVRQHDLADVLRELGSLPDAAILTAQNGVGAEEAARAARPDGALLAASVTAAVERTRDGSVGWLRRGGIGLAPVSGDVEPLLGRLVDAFGRTGLAARRYPDWRAMKWSKLLANLVANATSALLDLDPARIYADPALFALEREQLAEALRVIDGLGLRVVDLPGAPVAWLARGVRLPAPASRLALRRVVGGARGGKDPSLRIALAAGRETEVAWLNGAVARTAVELGLVAPVNATLARLVEEAGTEPERREWFRRRPDRLLAALGTS
jgi:2-dehydropantoate 2-reductase